MLTHRRRVTKKGLLLAAGSRRVPECLPIEVRALAPTSTSESPRLSRALLAALPLAVALSALGEVVSVLRQVPRVEAGLAFGVVGQVGQAMALRGWPLFALILAQAAVLASAEAVPSRRKAAAAVVMILALGQGVFAHHLLTVDTHMGPFVIFWVLMLGFGGLLGLVLGGCEVRPSPRVRLGFGLFFTIAAPIIWAIHYILVPDVYLPAESFVMITLSCLALGLALLAKTARLRRGIAVAGGVGVLLLAVSALVPSTLEARSSSYLFSALCRARVAGDAVAAEGDALWPRSPRPRSLEPDPSAVARFAEHNGLPALPEEFALGDYDVVLMISEALRYPDTSLADPALETMPNLAAFAEDALSFSEASSPSVATFPSTSAVLSMTTLSFAEVEILPHFTTGRLREEALTAPEAMSASGYATFWAGHNGGVAFTSYMLGLDQGFADVHHFVMGDSGTDDHDVVAASIGEIRRHREANDRFFGMVFFQAPHSPYRVHDESRPSATARDRYRQELRFVDERMGEVFAEIDRGDGADRTVVIVIGDHGEAFGEHRVAYHSSNVHREQAHIPMVVRIPGVPAARLDAPTSSSFVLPWLLLAGPPPAREAAEAALRVGHGPLFRETEGAVLVELLGHRHLRTALRYPTHTVLYDFLGDTMRIYDTAADPDEQHDLAPLDPELRRRFRPRVDAYRRARFAGERFAFIDGL